MIVHNNAMCGIIIPGIGEELEGLIAPGASLEIPDSMRDHPFVAGLLERGELVERDAPGRMGIDELRAKCDELGVKYDNRWGVKRLQEEIEAA